MVGILFLCIMAAKFLLQEGKAVAAKAKLTAAQIERARTLLQELPEKDDRKTREEAAGLLEKDFRKALKKGYTPKELSAMLKNANIAIPAYLVKNFLTPEREPPRPKALKPAPKKPAERAPADGQFVVKPDTPLEDL